MGKIELKDVIHFYLNNNVLFKLTENGIDFRGKLVGVNKNEIIIENEDGIIITENIGSSNQCKLLLRKLNKMNEIEAKDYGLWDYDKKEVKNLTNKIIQSTSLGFLDLCKNGFDLFNLIDNNLAIELGA